MKTLLVNGSPRKAGNTATALAEVAWLLKNLMRGDAVPPPAPEP